MKYFSNCTSVDQIKSLYKKLAMQHHPDRGGDTYTMQQINTEYAFACAKAMRAEGFTVTETNQRIKLSEEYRKVIERIIALPGIAIEVVGHWIWVTGDTYAVRDKLKAAGLFFAPKKQAWYYRSEIFKTKGGKKSLDEIRRKYGSEHIYGKVLR